MAAVTILMQSALAPAFDKNDGNLKVKRFYLHIASVANGGTALEQNSIARAVRLPKGAVIDSIKMRWEAGGGTNTLAVRRTAVSDGTTHTDIKTGLTGGSAGYWQSIDETAGAEYTMNRMTVESWIDIEFAGSNGWPVDKYISGQVVYSMPSTEDEIALVDGTIDDDLGV